MNLAKDVKKLSDKDILKQNKIEINEIANKSFEIMNNHKNYSYFSKDINKEKFINKIKTLITPNEINVEKPIEEYEKYPLNTLLFLLSSNYSSLIEIESTSFLYNTILILTTIQIKKNNEIINNDNMDLYFKQLSKLMLDLYKLDKNNEIIINNEQYSFVSICSDQIIFDFVEPLITPLNSLKK